MNHRPREGPVSFCEGQGAEASGKLGGWVNRLPRGRLGKAALLRRLSDQGGRPERGGLLDKKYAELAWKKADFWFLLKCTSNGSHAWGRLCGGGPGMILS